MLRYLKSKRSRRIEKCNEQIKEQAGLLGPFVGSITESSVKIWIHLPGTAPERPNYVYVTLHNEIESPATHYERIEITDESLGVGIAEFAFLKPDSRYFYRLWMDEKNTISLFLQDLGEAELHFRTLPEKGYDRQLDFLLMSCHNPFAAKDDGHCGFAVWKRMPEIIKKNKNVRFAILTGDQVYADEIESEVLNEQDARKREEAYIRIYRKFWSDINYRRVLCSLPAVLMWDDHDITDGWGSRVDSFTRKNPKKIKPEWRRLFRTAKKAFRWMQAERNPPPLSKDFESGFDTCFKIGRAGFAVVDLRSNRNVGRKRIWSGKQLEKIKNWVEANKNEIDTLFFVSSVVFSHDDSKVNQIIHKFWYLILDMFKVVKYTGFRKLSRWFSDSIGDLRDDINDSWGAEVNQKEADKLLDFLFSVQNQPRKKDRVNVVILTGDIHTPGYSTIYSAHPKHKRRAVIPHIVATPVAYKPFSWIGEAVFRHLSRTVELGSQKTKARTEERDKETRKIIRKSVHQYTAQVSHHFCYRNVVVVSLRNYEKDESHLKVKYYLEGYPEPQIMLFDLNYSSRREAIRWEDIKAVQPLP